jgi:hypothetical protein
MAKPKKKMRLKRRSLRELEGHALAEVQGGGKGAATTACDSTGVTVCIQTIRLTQANHNQHLAPRVAPMTRNKRNPIRLKRRSVRALDDQRLQEVSGGGHRAPDPTTPLASCGNCAETIRLSGSLNHNQHLGRRQ